jgi:hypothetical protein
MVTKILKTVPGEPSIPIAKIDVEVAVKARTGLHFNRSAVLPYL